MAVVYSLVVPMRKMMKKQMLFMIQLIGEWMIEEKREGKFKLTIILSIRFLIYPFTNYM